MTQEASDHTSAVTDFIRDEVHHIAPNDPNLPLATNVVHQAQALTSEGWTRVRPEVVFRLRGPAWSLVNMKPADRLPFMDVQGMSHLRVNQFCEVCKESELCSTHAALASNDNVDFVPKHIDAMKAAGYCMVECGGAGDCFYYSMLFLASIYNVELYHAWHDHKNLRKKTCDNLLVTCYIMLCLLMFLSILKLYPGSQQFASSASRE